MLPFPEANQATDRALVIPAVHLVFLPNHELVDDRDGIPWMKARTTGPIKTLDSFGFPIKLELNGDFQEQVEFRNSNSTSIRP